MWNFTTLNHSGTNTGSMGKLILSKFGDFCFEETLNYYSFFKKDFDKLLAF